MTIWVRETSPNVFVAMVENIPIIVHASGVPDVTWPFDIVNSWTTEMLTDIEVFSATPFEVPEGYATVGAPTYSRQGGQVVQNYTVVELPPAEIPPDPTPPTPPPPPVVPSTVPPEIPAGALRITRSQLILQLYTLGRITSAEALSAARTGTVPAFLQSTFTAMTEPAKTRAYVNWASVPSYGRTDPLILALAQAAGWTSDQTDEYFRTALTAPQPP